jgi:hypothetical protein
VTITTGAALAPDDGASSDAESRPAGPLLETDTSTENGIALAIAPDVVPGRSLTAAPDVVSHLAQAVTPDVGSQVSLVVAPDLSTVEQPGPSPANEHLTPELDSPLLSVIALSTAETPPAPPRVPLPDRLRAGLPFTGPGLTGPGGVVLGCLVVGLGAAGDLALGHGLGMGFTATFLLGCVLVAAALRTRALAVAMVLPPLLYAGGCALETKTSGQTAGRREMALDVATSLALHAPALFIGTALAVAIVLGRVIVHLIRR